MGIMWSGPHLVLFDNLLGNFCVQKTALLNKVRLWQLWKNRNKLMSVGFSNQTSSYGSAVPSWPFYFTLFKTKPVILQVETPMIDWRNCLLGPGIYREDIILLRYYLLYTSCDLAMYSINIKVVCTITTSETFPK